MALSPWPGLDDFKRCSKVLSPESGRKRQEGFKFVSAPSAHRCPPQTISCTALSALLAFRNEVNLELLMGPWRSYKGHTIQVSSSRLVR